MVVNSTKRISIRNELFEGEVFIYACAPSFSHPQNMWCLWKVCMCYARRIVQCS